MPIFEYRCKKCGKVTEVLVLPGEEEPKYCDECGGELEKLPSFGVGFIFKGSGFYITDYKHKNYTEGGNGRREKEKEPAKKEENKSGNKSD